MEAMEALSSLARGSLPLPRGKGALFSKEVVLTYQEQLRLSSLLVSEDEVEGFSFPFEGRKEAQTSLVKV